MPPTNAQQTTPILIIGGGGREHALTWQLERSAQTGPLYVAPGNGGTERPDRGVFNVALDVSDHDQVVAFCRAKDIGLVVVGPEAPLADGIADALSAAGLRCFGPSRAAAQLEASKAYAKAFMARHNIPTAAAQIFDQAEPAKDYIRELDGPCVVKASGLAAGKGVLMCEDVQAGVAAIDTIMSDRKFGGAGATVVVEQWLIGEEVSVLAFCDGHSAVALPAAQDHKRLLEGDRGPNTGGMGAYAPAPVYTDALAARVQREILEPTLQGCRDDGTPFVGVLFAGLMITEQGPQVLEFNCRFGDPETQALMPLLDCDLFEVMSACVDGALKPELVRTHPLASATVVAASGGYPAAYTKGLPISGVGESPAPDMQCFHAGTRRGPNGELVTSGGRVLAVSAQAPTLSAALNAAYGRMAKISFKEMHVRKDIGWRAKSGGATYKDAGVNLEAGAEAVSLMKGAVEATHGPEVLAGVGAFGGLFDIGGLPARSVMVASTDGVGTKTKVAAVMGDYAGLGHDIVNHCINDILVQGARPLFFLDYVATSALDPQQIADVVRSCAEACGVASCALLGGETAEMPGVYTPGALDVVGTIVGVVERDKIIDGARIEPGDVVIGIGSSGLHTNGYSLARRVLDGMDWHTPREDLNGASIGEALLVPHKSYLAEVQALLTAGVDVKGLAHITGGGLIDNPPRILPDDVALELHQGTWSAPPIFELIQRTGDIASREMSHVFNNGLGMLVVLPADQQSVALETLAIMNDCEAWAVGVAVDRGQGEAVLFKDPA